MLPTLIERVRHEIALARVVGKFTVDVGVSELRRRLVGDIGTVASTSVESLVELTPPEVIPVDPIPTMVTADQLVLPDYDLLPAAHIVAKLASLTQAERDTVEEYERANRNRRTILGKLDQLRTRP